VFKIALHRPPQKEVLCGDCDEGDIGGIPQHEVIRRLSTSNMDMSDHIVVLTAILSAMVTRASVDYEPMIRAVRSIPIDRFIRTRLAVSRW
jgi:hypothetical protein